MPRRPAPAGPRLTAVVTIAATVAAITPSVHADNAALQALFFAACDDPAGALAERCGETPAGAGDLSGDSESSLNPSQTLGSTSASHSLARTRSQDGRDRGERLLDDVDAAVERTGLDLGPFSLLINGHYLDEDRDRDVDLDAERGYQLGAWGAQLGFDYRLGAKAVIGALITWETAELDFDRELPGANFVPQGRAGSMDQDSVGVAVFGNRQLGERGYLDISAGYIDSDYTLRRRAIFQESQRSVPQTLVETRATPDGEETWGALTLGYSGSTGVWAVDPYLGVTYSKAEVDGFEETDVTGSGLAMAVDRVSSRTVLGQAGVRLSRPISREGYVLLPQLSAEYVRELDRDGADTRVAYLLDQSGNSLALDGDRREADYFDIGLGVVMLLPNGWMPFLEYQATVGHDDLDRQRIAVGLRVEL